MSAEQLYRRGTARRLAADEPSGRALLVAYLAQSLTQSLSDAALRALGPERLVRLADVLVDCIAEDQVSELIDILQSASVTRRSVGNWVGSMIVAAADEELIQRLAARELPVRVADADGVVDEGLVDERAAAALRDRLDGSPFIRGPPQLSDSVVQRYGVPSGEPIEFVIEDLEDLDKPYRDRREGAGAF